MSKLNDMSSIIDFKYLSSFFDIIYLYIYIMPYYKAIFYINKVITYYHFIIVTKIILTIFFDYVNIADDERGTEKTS